MRTPTHKRLRLQHHRHTGKMLHHRHTSYHGLAVVVGLAGALIIMTAAMARAAADNLIVSARNPAPIPTIPAVITSPINNTTVDDAELAISGTCEAADPVNVVTMLDNGSVAGSAPCVGSGAFSLVITIGFGQHTLVARTYTITDDFGPDSDTVVVTRTAPPGTPTSPESPGSPGGSGSPSGGQADRTSLVVTAERPFITFGPGKDAVWAGTISGGKPPYRIIIDWGDNNTDKLTANEARELRLSHRYRKMRPYIISIGATDADEQNVVGQYAAVTPYMSPVMPSAPTKPIDKSLLFGLYGAYLLVLVVFGALWALAHWFKYALAPVPSQRPTNRNVRR